MQKVLAHPIIAPEDEEDFEDEEDVLDLRPTKRQKIDSNYPIANISSDYSLIFSFYRPELSAFFIVIPKIGFVTAKSDVSEDRRTYSISLSITPPPDLCSLIAKRTALAHNLVTHDLPKSEHSFVVQFYYPILDLDKLHHVEDEYLILKLYIGSEENKGQTLL
jgi:hypothetical protein